MKKRILTYSLSIVMLLTLSIFGFAVDNDEAGDPVISDSIAELVYGLDSEVTVFDEINPNTGKLALSEEEAMSEDEPTLLYSTVPEEGGDDAVLCEEDNIVKAVEAYRNGLDLQVYILQADAVLTNNLTIPYGFELIIGNTHVLTVSTDVTLVVSGKLTVDNIYGAYIDNYGEIFITESGEYFIPNDSIRGNTPIVYKPESEEIPEELTLEEISIELSSEENPGEPGFGELTDEDEVSAFDYLAVEGVFPERLTENKDALEGIFDYCSPVDAFFEYSTSETTVDTIEKTDADEPEEIFDKDDKSAFDDHAEAESSDDTLDYIEALEESEAAAFADTSNYKLVPSKGGWYLYRDEVFQSTFTGIAGYKGAEFYIEKGVLQDQLNGLVKINNKWYFLSSGQIPRVDGFVEYDNHWFIVKDGELDTGANGLYDYNGGTFLFSTGQLRSDVNGLWQNYNGKWYFLANGQVQSQYTGVAMYDGAFFVVEKGILFSDYNGTIEYDGTRFKVLNGQLVGKAEPDVVSKYDSNYKNFSLYYTSVMYSNVVGTQSWEISGTLRALLAMSLYKDLPSSVRQNQYTEALADGNVYVARRGSLSSTEYFVSFIGDRKELIIKYVPATGTAGYSEWKTVSMPAARTEMQTNFNYFWKLSMDDVAAALKVFKSVI